MPNSDTDNTIAGRVRTDRFECAFGDWQLERRPPTPNQPLQAWDAADSYLLEALKQRLPKPNRVLVINDQFGALALALQGFDPDRWSDSYTAELALQDNLARNQLASSGNTIASTTAPTGHYDAILWRVPKSMALLQQQAMRLQAVLTKDSVVLIGGMVKHLPAQVPELLRGLGSVTALLAQKKARVFELTPDPALSPIQALARPVASVPEYNLELAGDANVFAQAKLDIGARAFLAQFGKLPKAARIADLGCGNGILGIVAKRLQPDASVVFLDESHQAVAAAMNNYARNIGQSALPLPEFHLDDCLSHYQGESFDLVLCNPPFHQSHALGDQIAWQMFSHSLKHLRSAGELWVVGNRHLDYHLKLKRLFGNCKQIAADAKFVVLAAKRR